MSQEAPQPGRTAGPNAHARGGHSWIAWIIGAVVLVVVSVASLAVLADLAARTMEMDQLLTAIESSESAMEQAQDEVTTAMAPYVEGNMTEKQRVRLQARLKAIAAEGQQAIGQAGVEVQSVSVLPWHSRIADAQRAYLRHNTAWVAYMIAASDRPEQWFVEQPEVNDSFAAAKEPLIKGVTLFDFGQAMDRLEEIFAPDEPDEDSRDDGPSGGNSQPAGFPRSICSDGR